MNSRILSKFASSLRSKYALLGKNQRWIIGVGSAVSVTFGTAYYLSKYRDSRRTYLSPYTYANYYSDRYRYPTHLENYLKQAVWDESSNVNYNYTESLHKYIEVLNKLQDLKVNPLSDEYTRIELKIAEMFEKLDLHENAKNIYLEMLYRFFESLNTPGVVPDEMRPELIRKDLRVLIKSLEVNKDLEIGKRNLLAHLLLAQEEILIRSPELKKFFDSKREKAEKLVKGKPINGSEFKSFVNDENLKFNEDGYMIMDIQKNTSAWEPFKEEFFTARDLYTAYCLSAKDVPSALSCKMTTVQWMIMADMPPGQILLAQANLGALLYLQAEKFESDLFQIDSKCKIDPGFIEDEKVVKALRYLRKNRDTCLQMANQCYDSILKFSNDHNKLRYHMKDQLDTAIPQAIALSTYGKGILNLHNGVLNKAERHLSDAISLAKETDFEELLKEAEGELKKAKDLKEHNNSLDKSTDTCQ
ncbi:similar to Saccharomyces cerevisiae YMR115W MGR3 Subunit of the mitochondrial (mt) i-AAA protease supercomplex, which degrades misfolded mitochondrial proteins [Maudiozyma barnettii]|uniref:Similar to Saccharomyces cerevisiae YMR115W MGR3 Subunit of the mitochondrial (Mt) i-AAA protease supercomplex, which degrades misfolded mitochondrial proteins n=1 Tax=Maudiozyma barnettii TaxID=61262 RepID=A0A8H2VFD4_9SACH|nr:Mgr3p [Kazachstania barnettii]CAB4254451.1 similar to Saccharomyces cerevisiae YMR115W MGR3 Subunit of the mitochondrial (mt) i-AAA protease supercomplex, which degrades misfolded mitochondrial proteins [Kazachstania barnettii]CAD1782413.1 similar to Saccharomyces cerevisiae YMR115W MGR3 Subunit of the mitochondrial (mt) i-AAA protease supercomplex, which degrades misfolded mitochondrial proteins [Kazachstania barnettii]